MKILRDLTEERALDRLQAQSGIDSLKMAQMRKRQQRRTTRQDQVLRLISNLRFDQQFMQHSKNIMEFVIRDFKLHNQKLKTKASLSQQMVYLFFQFFNQAGLQNRQQQLISLLQSTPASLSSFFGRMIVIVVQLGRKKLSKLIEKPTVQAFYRNTYKKNPQVSFFKPRQMKQTIPFRYKQLEGYKGAMVSSFNHKIKQKIYHQQKPSSPVLDTQKFELCVTNYSSVKISRSNSSNKDIKIQNIKNSTQIKHPMKIRKSYSIDNNSAIISKGLTLRQIISIYKKQFMNWIQLIDLNDLDISHFRGIKKTNQLIQDRLKNITIQGKDRAVRQRLFDQQTVAKTIKNYYEQFKGQKSYQNNNNTKNNIKRQLRKSAFTDRKSLRYERSQKYQKIKKPIQLNVVNMGRTIDID